MDLTEAEDIEKKGQEYTEELYKKDLHDPDNRDGVTTHLEQDSFRNTSTSALLTTPKPLTVRISANCGKFLKRWEYQTTLRAS